MPSSRVRQPSAKARAAAGETSLTPGSVVSTSKATASMPTSTGSRSRTATSATSSSSAAAATRKSARGRGKGTNTAATEEDERALNKGHPDDGDDDDEEHKDDAASDDEEPHRMDADANENENEDDDDQDDAYDDHMGMSNSKEPDFTLYCICLGLAGEQPMIQCDHCSNWFHFSCVGIDDDTAAMIESYCCDICAGMGKGVTCYSTAGLQDRVGASGAASDSEEENDDVFRTSETGPSLDPSKGLESQDEDQEEEECEDGNEDDEEYVVSVGKRMKVKEHAMQAPGSRERKKPKLEGTSTQTAKKRAPRRRVDKDDEEFIVGDDEAIDGHKRATAASAIRKTSHSKPKTSTTATAGPSSNTKDATLVDAQAPIQVPDAPPTDRVRAHVVKQLHTIFLSIFTASTEVPPEYHSNEDRAISFATDVEGDLFQGFAEVDLKAHVRGPRAKYSSKFRSLHYNLKTNENFRERIAANELSSMQIMAMTNEDLMRPELKKMAESVRAASLKHSVKEVIGVPTAKRTHKGEEEIGTDTSQRLLEEEENAFVLHERAGSTSTSENVPSRTAQISPRAISPIEGRMSPPARTMSPLRYGSGSPPPQTRSPIVRETSPIINPGSPSRSGKDSKAPPRPESMLANSDEGAKVAPSPVSDRRDSFGPPGSPPFDRPPSDSPVVDNSPFPVARAARQRQRSSFDMASIWNKVKASTNPDAEQVKQMPEQTATDDAVMSVLDELKATVTPAANAPSAEPGMPTYADDEDFEDELFGTTAKGKARRRALPSSVAEMVESSSAVWHNDFFVPEEGGFPAYAVQVGGRPLGIDGKAWAQILPQEPWTTAGRLSTDQAFKYLLDCWGSSKRELIVLGVMPDLQGPTPESPHRPTKEKCLVKHQHVVDFHLRIDRVGVVPPKEVKNLVKDLYIVPLRKDTPLPDFLQVLDECDIPQNRETDLLLAVLVIQKNALPTVQPPVPTLAAPKTASPAPSSRSPLPPPPSVSASTTAAPAPTVSPASSSAAAEPVLPAFDAASLASLSSLLSNPSLIQSLASVSAAPFSPNVPSRVPTSFPPPPPPPGFVPPPGFSPLPPGTRGTNGSGGGWSPTTLAPLGSVSPYGATTPQWNGNSNPSNYSPHAIRDGRSPMHASASASSSSSTTGQGSGPLSNTGGIHPSRLALLEGAGMDGRDGRSHHPSSRDREQDSYRGGQRGSGWGARGRGGR